MKLTCEVVTRLQCNQVMCDWKVDVSLIWRRLAYQERLAVLSGLAYRG